MHKSIYLIVSTLVLFISPVVHSHSATGDAWMTAPEMLVAQKNDQDKEPSLDLTDWQKFQTKEAEIWLPKSYIGGELSSDDIDRVIAEAETLGPDFRDIGQLMKTKKELFHFKAFDKNLGKSGFKTNMNIASGKVPSSVSSNDVMDMTIQNLPPSFQLIDSKMVSLDHYEAGQLTVKLLINGNEVKTIQYYIKDGDTVWVITYGSGIEEFEKELPVFQKSIRTFKVLP